MYQTLSIPTAGCRFTHFSDPAIPTSPTGTLAHEEGPHPGPLRLSQEACAGPQVHPSQRPGCSRHRLRPTSSDLSAWALLSFPTAATSISEVPKLQDLGLSIIESNECKRLNLAAMNCGLYITCMWQVSRNKPSDRVKGFFCQLFHPVLGHGGRGVRGKTARLLSSHYSPKVALD